MRGWARDEDIMTLLERTIDVKDEQGEKLVLRQINPCEYGYGDALKTAELSLRSFEDGSLNKYRLPKTYHYKGLLNRLRYNVLDPEKMLNEFIKGAQRYRNLCHLQASGYLLDAQRNSMKCYEIYSHQGQPLGYLSMRYPSFDVPEVSQEISSNARFPRIHSLWWWVYVRWTKVKFKVINYFRTSPRLFGGGGEPKDPEYAERVLKEQKHIESKLPTEAQLAKESFEQLHATNYPRSHYYLLFMLMVDPRYQGKGLGRILIETAVNDITATTVQFSDGTNIAHGPVKIEVKGTIEGKPLYDKLGFKTFSELHFDDPGKPISAFYRMDKVKPYVN